MQGMYGTPLLLVLAAALSAERTVLKAGIMDEVDDVENRIIGGKEAKKNQFPYQAALINGNGYRCGGSLIQPQWVLTAAHCVHGQKKLGALLGATNRANSPGSHFSWADRTYTHPQANPGHGGANDIALLHLKNPPRISNQIRPINLPRDDQGPTRHQGMLGTITGWGGTRPGGGNVVSNLKYGQLPIQTPQQCNQAKAGARVSQTNFCGLANPKTGDAGCFGDSGGPFVHNGKQLGVTSFVYGKCDAGTPTGFVNVGSHLGWINQHINGGQAPQKQAQNQPEYEQQWGAWQARLQQWREQWGPQWDQQQQG